MGFIGLYEEEFEHAISVNESDENGCFSYYFASNENKTVNYTFIYFKETKRHMFYKFCSKECCKKWVG